MMRGYVYAALAAAALALVAYAASKAYTAIYQAGANACEASHARAAEKATVEVERRDAASAAASDSILNYLAANLPRIEGTKNATAERVRTVYRDRVVPSGCERPAGVQSDLDAALARVNAAAAGQL